MWKKCGIAREGTDDNIVWGIRIAWCVTKVTNTRSEYVILVLSAFHGKHVFANALHCYVYT